MREPPSGVLPVLGRGVWLLAGVRAEGAIPAVPSYTCRDRHGPDSIGKFYCGREIAKGMGHAKALWPERPDRAWQEQPERAIAALLVDADREFASPRARMRRVVAALTPGGRVALVEYRSENPFIPSKGLHNMTLRQLRREMAAVGLTLQEAREILPRQHLAIFERAEG